MIEIISGCIIVYLFIGMVVYTYMVGDVTKKGYTLNTQTQKGRDELLKILLIIILTWPIILLKKAAIMAETRKQDEDSYL